MKTKVLKISPSSPDLVIIKKAAGIIAKGGLVAFPTETVYGLGAYALNPKACLRIFKAKGRPADNPLIVHIASKKQLFKLVSDFPADLEKISKHFWPGPLSVVLPKSPKVPKEVTAGLNTIAIRWPDHKIALELIKQAGPIAAPSANLSGGPSPTLAEHVLKDLDGRIELILDGGVTKVGLESTVLDLTCNSPQLLRPGGITLEQLRSVLGLVNYQLKQNQKKLKAKSPGLKYCHYTPKAQVILVTGNHNQIKSKIKKLIIQYHNRGPIGVISKDKFLADQSFVFNNIEHYAKNLFKKFRDFDQIGIKTIFVQAVSKKGLGLALMNRLKKAANKIY